jgi:hypothetical protein
MEAQENQRGCASLPQSFSHDWQEYNIPRWRLFRRLSLHRRCRRLLSIFTCSQDRQVMSGIEIVGIVLGALPLFISAAEHYREGLGFVRRAIRKHTFIAQYRDELIAQRALLGLYIKEILERTKLPAETQADLIENPDGDSWRKADVVAALSKELGDAYRPFVTLLTKICAILAKQIKSTEAAEPTLTEDELVGPYLGHCFRHC